MTHMPIYVYLGIGVIMGNVIKSAIYIYIYIYIYILSVTSDLVLL